MLPWVGVKGLSTKDVLQFLATSRLLTAQPGSAEMQFTSTAVLQQEAMVLLVLKAAEL